MTEDQYIASVRRLNPDVLDAQTLRFHQGGLEKLLRHAYRAGKDHTTETLRVQAGDMPEFMRDFLGK